MSFDSNVSLRDRQKILHINNDDVAVTRAMVEAGKNLDVSLLDHIVIGGNSSRWVSLKERGLGFGNSSIQEKRSSYKASEAVAQYDVSHHIIEALPGEYVIFPEDATEDTWHLFLDAYDEDHCPVCGGKGCILSPAGGVHTEGAQSGKGMSKSCNYDLRPCPECGGWGSR